MDAAAASAQGPGRDEATDGAAERAEADRRTEAARKDAAAAEARAGQERLEAQGRAARRAHEAKQAGRAELAREARTGAPSASSVPPSPATAAIVAGMERSAAERGAGLALEGVQLAQAAGTMTGGGTMTDAVPGAGLGIDPGELARLGRGAVRGGALALGAAALDHARDLAEDVRVRGAAERMGLDAATPEGLLAADAYEATMEMASAGAFERPGIEVEKGRGAEARILAEASALHELAHPGTFERTRPRAGMPADPAALEAVHAARMAALAAHRAGALPVADAAAMAAGAPWSGGWTETFPAITDAERALGELPGLAPATLAAQGWTEGMTAADPELTGPQSTGGTAPAPAVPGVEGFDVLPEALQWSNIVAMGDTVPENRLSHVFTEKHRMEPLIERFGSQKDAYEAVMGAAQEALEQGNLNLSARGYISETLLDVGGVAVHVVGGNIVDGRIQSINASRMRIGD